jgi:anti-anti-sigma factor
VIVSRAHVNPFRPAPLGNKTSPPPGWFAKNHHNLEKVASRDAHCYTQRRVPHQEEPMNAAFQHITAHEDAGVLVLTVMQERIHGYDLAEALGSELIAAARQRPKGDVIVDLRRVEQMSSVGFGPFISLRGRVREGGGRLVLCGLRPTIFDLFQATHLLINPSQPRSLFLVADTVADAGALLERA